MTTDEGELFRVGDVEMTNVGRRQRGSKKRIRFRYAIKVADDGGGGGGMKHRNVFEHEVVLLWSFHSGKAVVHHDGVEIKSDRKSHPSVVDITWTEPSPGEGGFVGGNSDGGAEAGRVFRVVCCRTKPINSPDTFRKYELVVDGTPLNDYPPLPGHTDDEAAADGEYSPSPGYGAAGGGGSGSGPGGVPMSILEVLFPDGNYGCKKRTQDQLCLSYRAEEDTLQYSDDGSNGSFDEPNNNDHSADLLGFGPPDAAKGGAAAADAGAPPTDAAPTPAAEDGALVPAPQSAPGDLLGNFDALAVGGGVDPAAASGPPEENGTAGAVVPHPAGTTHAAGYGADLLSAFGAAPEPPATAPPAHTPNSGDGDGAGADAADDPFALFGGAPAPEAAAAVVPHPDGTPAVAGYGLEQGAAPAPAAAPPAPPAAPAPAASDNPFDLFGGDPAPEAATAVVPLPEGTPAAAGYGLDQDAAPAPAAAPPAPASDDPFAIFGSAPVPAAVPADPFA